MKSEQRNRIVPDNGDHHPRGVYLRPLDREGLIGVRQTASRCKHLLKHRQHALECTWRDPAQVPYKTVTINSSHLVQYDVPDLPFETTRHPKGILMTTRRQWGDDMSSQVTVQFVRGYDDTRPYFLDFTASCRIQIDQVHVTALDRPHRYHCHSSSSKEVST